MKTQKSYHNIKFLNSPSARPIRILSEYFEPFDRLVQEGIEDTVVFFGSSRLISRKDARKRLMKIRNTKKTHKDYQIAKIFYKMSRYYNDAVKLSYLLTKWSVSNFDNKRFVVCSGGGPGIMEAANLGAWKAGGKSIGLNISIPKEQSSNRFITPNLNFEFHYFFMRKFWFVYLAKAMVMFPGGLGTCDELMEVLTLLQTRKIKKRVFILLYGQNYWNEVINFKAMVRFQTIDKRDLNLFQIVDSPEEAYDYLINKISKYYLK